MRGCGGMGDCGGMGGCAHATMLWGRYLPAFAGTAAHVAAKVSIHREPNNTVFSRAQQHRATSATTPLETCLSLCQPARKTAPTPGHAGDRRRVTAEKCGSRRRSPGLLPRRPIDTRKQLMASHGHWPCCLPPRVLHVQKTASACCDGRSGRTRPHRRPARPPPALKALEPLAAATSHSAWHNPSRIAGSPSPNPVRVPIIARRLGHGQ